MQNADKDQVEPNEEIKHLFIFGLGYSATFLAQKLMAAGWLVSGTVRNPDKADRFRHMGIAVYHFDGESPCKEFAEMLPSLSHILSSVPAKGNYDDTVVHWHGEDLKQAKHLQWIGYYSTTGVYGDRAGGWVDETSALEPTGPRGQARVDAEKAWFELGAEGNIPVHSFRLAGIYGPGRNALETVKQGRARRIHKEGQVFSRIHVEDIVQITIASMLQPNAGQAYNCCDDNPDAPEKVIAYACELLGQEPPPLLDFETADLSPMARSFYNDNKRVSNQRVKKELGVNFNWPDYRDALATLFKEGQIHFTK